MLASLPANTINPLQSLLDAVAHLMFFFPGNTTACRHFFNDYIGCRWSSPSSINSVVEEVATHAGVSGKKTDFYSNLI